MTHIHTAMTLKSVTLNHETKQHEQIMKSN